LLTAPRSDPCGRDSRTRLPPWVHDGEAPVRIRMKDSRLRKPVGGETVHPPPRETVLLAAPTQRTQPNAFHMIVECRQCSAVGWHCMVGEEASDHLLDPSPLLGDWAMHSPSQFLLDLPERRPHAIAPCDPLHEELPTAVAFADEGEGVEPSTQRSARLSGPVARRRAPPSVVC
jgi:hypothetical protein